MRDMKPAFALDFRDATLGLLHRTGAGWTQIGTVALDDPDLTQGLGYLRSTALGLSPRGISTKLIIPNDQILYLTLSAPGPDAAKRRAQIAVALEGRTPYDVADLVFDWSGTGPEVQVGQPLQLDYLEVIGCAHGTKIQLPQTRFMPQVGLHFIKQPMVEQTGRL